MTTAFSVFGILAYGQIAERAQPKHEDQQIDDDRQDRLADEDVGEIHGVCPLALLRPRDGKDRITGEASCFDRGRVTRRSRAALSRRRWASNQCSCGVGFGLFAGCTLLSIVIGEPLFNLTCPLVTTSVPSSRPLTIAT